MFKSSTTFLRSILNNSKTTPVISLNSYSNQIHNTFSHINPSLLFLNNNNIKKDFLFKNNYSTETKKRSVFIKFLDFSVKERVLNDNLKIKFSILK